jgi:hypothetical protein
MPILSLTEKDHLLAATDITFVSLHSEYSSSGGFELVGGTPTYVRQPVTFASTIAGTLSMVGTATFDVPGPTTVAWIGFWTTGGVFCGMQPLGGDNLKLFTTIDVTNSPGVVVVPNHDYVVGEFVVMWKSGEIALPQPLLEAGTLIIGSVVDINQITLTYSNILVTPVDFGFGGAGFLQRIVPIDYPGQGTYTLQGLFIDARLAA